MSNLFRFLPLVALMLCAPVLAMAEDHGESDEGEVHHKHVLAVRAISLMEVKEEGEPEFFVGPGMLIERSLIHHVLEIELSAALLFGRGQTLPVDVLLKKPFHINEKVDLYLGAGGALTFIFPEEGEQRVHPGTIVSAGSYFWFKNDMGIQFELDYAILFEEHLVHEFETAVGMIFRF